MATWSLRDPAGPQSAAFARDKGYVALRGVVGIDDVGQLAVLVGRWLQDAGLLTAEGRAVTGTTWTGVGFDDPRWIALQQHVWASEEATAIRSSTMLQAFLGDLLGTPVTPGRGDICRVAWPQALHHTTGPHQDGAYMPASNDPAPWTVWIPLARCDRDDGGLGVWPESYKRGLLDHTGAGLSGGCEVPDDASWVTGSLDVGDALVFAPTTVHKAWPNQRADVPRLSVDLRFSGPDSSGAR